MGGWPQQVPPQAEEILNDSVNGQESMLAPNSMTDDMRRKSMSVMVGYWWSLKQSGSDHLNLTMPWGLCSHLVEQPLWNFNGGFLLLCAMVARPDGLIWSELVFFQYRLGSLCRVRLAETMWFFLEKFHPF
jgi:hypothetical protein